MGVESMPELSARVFISCGQNKISDEVTIATKIKDKLVMIGFDPYMAVQEQTLRGLKENIFEKLSSSEYFLFVDFKRERLDVPSGVHRGSLFSHQELAIASYLNIPVLAFQEFDVKNDDGILQIVQANAIKFSDRAQLPALVAEEIDKRKETWNPDWRNELILERDPKQFSQTQFQDGRGCRFFHVGVRNRHRSNTARNCYAYLQSVTKLDPRVDVPVRQVEFGWAGYSQPNAHVLAGKSRAFDAFYIMEGLPTRLQFNVFATGTDYIPNIVGAGPYELGYAVVSENFPEARATFLLNLDPLLERTTLLPSST